MNQIDTDCDERVLVAHYKEAMTGARRHANAHELVRYFGLTWEAAVAEVAVRDGRGRKSA